jgi:hypothetical protein
LTRAASRVHRTVRGATPAGSRRWLKYAVEAGCLPAFVPRVTTIWGFVVRWDCRCVRQRCSADQLAGRPSLYP